MEGSARWALDEDVGCWRRTMGSRAKGRAARSDEAKQCQLIDRMSRRSNAPMEVLWQRELVRRLCGRDAEAGNSCPEGERRVTIG